jgi:hypothetical protein
LAVATVVALVALAVAAALDGAWLVVGVLGAAAIVLLIRGLLEAAAATAAVLAALQAAHGAES